MPTPIVLFDGKPVGSCAFQVSPPTQRMHRVNQIGGPSQLVPGRVEPGAIVVALDPNASIAWLDDPTVVEIEHEGERALIHVTSATGSVGQMTLMGFVQPRTR